MDEKREISQMITASEKRDLQDFELLEQLAKDDVSFLSSLSTVDKVLEDHHIYVNDSKNTEISSSAKDYQTDEGNCSLDNNLMDLRDSFAFHDDLDAESWSSRKSQDEVEDGDSDDDDEGCNGDHGDKNQYGMNARDDNKTNDDYGNDYNAKIDNHDNSNDISDDDDTTIENNHNDDDNGVVINDSEEEDDDDDDDDEDDDDHSSTKQPSRFHNQEMLSQLAERFFPGMREATGGKVNNNNNNINNNNNNNNNNNSNNNKINTNYLNKNINDINKTKISTIKDKNIKILKDISNNSNSDKIKNKKLDNKNNKDDNDNNNKNNNNNKNSNDNKSNNSNKINKNISDAFEMVRAVPVGGGVTSALLKGKMAELEGEIRRFKRENEILSEQRTEQSNYLKLLKKELAEFEMQKKKDREEFEKYKSCELQKMKKDRKIFENYKLAQESNFTRESRKEMDALKKQLEEFKSGMKEKEKKHQLGLERMKERVGALEGENERLKDELVLREMDRCALVKQLEALRKGGEGGEGCASLGRSSGGGVGDGGRQEKADVSKVIRLTEASKDPSAEPPDINAKYLTTTTDNLTSHTATNNTDTTDYTAIATTTTEILNRSILSDGSSVVHYSNGTTKTTRPDGHTTTTYFNGDTKDSFPDGRSIYYYANSKTKHHTFTDGTEIYYFQSGQTEKHYPVGTREVTFPDGTIKYIDPLNACEETIFTDGSVLKTFSSGKTEMEFANGQREVHSDTFRRREYPDGTSKTVFNDGTQQTTYPSGRVRVKDALGNVLFDGVK